MTRMGLHEIKDVWASILMNLGMQPGSVPSVSIRTSIYKKGASGPGFYSPAGPQTDNPGPHVASVGMY